MKYSIITSTYNQLDLLKKVKVALDGQTFKDFEWIIADDGSSDGTKDWAEKQGITYCSQADDGYRLVEILNLAAEMAQGEYLVWIMADSYPKSDFLEKLDQVVRPNRMVNGLRMNVDEDDKVVSPDWRVELFPIMTAGRVAHNERPVMIDEPWKAMTLNSMCMPRIKYEEMGGIFPGYKGYGRMDWDMAAWCFFHNMNLYWACEAIIYHRQHTEREDTQDNVDLFYKRLEEFRAETL